MSLELILGPMFSGKTTRLMQMYHIHSFIHPDQIAVVNYWEDQRYTNNEVESIPSLYSHNQTKIPCCSLQNLKQLQNDPSYYLYRVILINEAQFFDDLKEFVIDAVEIHHKKVILFGLDGDYMRRPFTNLLELIPYCDSVEKLKALCCRCRDGTEASFTHRLVDSTELKLMGASDKYESLCRKCMKLAISPQ